MDLATEPGRSGLQVGVRRARRTARRITIARSTRRATFFRGDLRRARWCTSSASWRSLACCDAGHGTATAGGAPRGRRTRCTPAPASTRALAVPAATTSCPAPSSSAPTFAGSSFADLVTKAAPARTGPATSGPPQPRERRTGQGPVRRSSRALHRRLRAARCWTAMMRAPARASRTRSLKDPAIAKVDRGLRARARRSRRRGSSSGCTSRAKR